MFFEGDDESYFSPDLSHAVRRRLSAICTNLDITPYGLRSVPTHTEDGIPIRKLYVSNLPPKYEHLSPAEQVEWCKKWCMRPLNQRWLKLTGHSRFATRNELFGVFAQYGFIKSCWLRIGEKGPNRTPTPTYAFVTYSSPGDAHRALQAPEHEKMLRGRLLRISPADSWHQPAVDPDGRVRWKPRGQRREEPRDQLHVELRNALCDEPRGQSRAASDASCDLEPLAQGSSEHGECQIVEASVSTVVEVESTGEPTYNILDILNTDCVAHILTYVPICDLIRSERVSKGWQNMVHEYCQSVRTYKTSWWQYQGVTLTTAVLRRVLQRLDCLTRLHIDHHWSALNDRTAHTVGKFCPNLEELKVVGMHTKNWNPLIYGCKQLKVLSFVSCSKLTDNSLVHIIKSDCKIESLTVANNTHVTGLFLNGTNPTSLNSLAFYNCFSLQSTVLCSAIQGLPNLTSLKLDVCPENIFKVVPTILKNLPKLEELSLSEYAEMYSTAQAQQDFCEALGNLKELKVLNLSRNRSITNAVLKQVAHNCSKLHTLNVANCNSKRNLLNTGVTDDGILAITNGCLALEVLDASYLAGLSDAGLMGLVSLPRLIQITVRGNPALTHVPFSAALQHCPTLQEIDACGCDNVGVEIVGAALSSVRLFPRPLVVRVAATAVPHATEGAETHKLLVVDTTDDRSNANLRPDFFDRIFETHSDDSLEDYYDDDFDDFEGDDDDFLLHEQLNDYNQLIAYGIQGANILLL